MMSNTTIDWAQPLEAVHEDGRVISVDLEDGPDAGGDYVTSDVEDFNGIWHSDGKAWEPEMIHRQGVNRWIIRNVATPAAPSDEWGPEIKVDGKRPEWLEKGANIMGRYAAGCYNFYNGEIEQEQRFDWSKLDTIRLPANHPHYRTHSPATPPLSLSTVVDRVERMEALVRRMAGNSSMGEPYEEDRVITYNSDHYCEARAIVSELPPLPDPDLVKAREIVAEVYYDVDRPELAKQAIGGDMDGRLRIQATLRGIKAGREMGR